MRTNRDVSRKRRALVVNCYADESRYPVARKYKIPQPVGPVYLAGGFNPDRWEIRLYNELAHGPLQDARLAEWPDIVVLTGLLTSLDRMRHVTAYVRTRRPDAIVVAGGHVARAFPRYCATFLDHVCLGDVDQIREVIAAEFGPSYAAEEMIPRFDLADWIGYFGYAESSRYCAFNCDFCTLTAEGRTYDPYGIDELQRTLTAARKSRMTAFVDNNFYGNDRRSFRERTQCIGEAWKAGKFSGWGTLVTNDFFSDPSNLETVKAAGCVGLFTGVESFDSSWNIAQNKRQNGGRPQADIIRECLEAGVVFLYGLVLDLTSRSIANVREELDYIISNPELTLPYYLSLSIPIPPTPFFFSCLDRGLILPRTKIRDLDATTISLRPQDSLEEAAAFARDLQSMRGYRWRMVRHALGFMRRYRRSLTADQMKIALSGLALLTKPLLATLPARFGSRGGARTHVSTTEPLDSFYTPALPIAAKYEQYFEPTMLTDEKGRLAPEVVEDLTAHRAAAIRPLARAITTTVAGHPLTVPSAEAAPESDAGQVHVQAGHGCA